MLQLRRRQTAHSALNYSKFYETVANATVFSPLTLSIEQTATGAAYADKKDRTKNSPAQSF
jgi:hypothetical protein